MKQESLEGSRQRKISGELVRLGIIPNGVIVARWLGPAAPWEWHLILSNGQSVVSRHSLEDCALAPALGVSAKAERLVIVQPEAS